MANWPTVGATSAAKGLVGSWRRVAARAGFITTSMRLHHDRNLPADRPLLIPTVGDIAIFGPARAGRIISVVTGTAPGRYAAVAVARAVVSYALNRQALSPGHSAGDRARHRSGPAA